MSVSSKFGTNPGSDPHLGGPNTITTTVRDKVFACQFCDRSFGYKYSLRNHERTHTGEKPYECLECDKRFAQKNNLKSHMRGHRGEKPYECGECSKKFTRKSYLKTHMRIHTGEKPYHCTLCQKRFYTSSNLKMHLLIHKGEKPFECKKCKKRFKQNCQLKRHKCMTDEENIEKPSEDMCVTVSPADSMWPHFDDIPVVEIAATIASLTTPSSATATSSSSDNHLLTDPHEGSQGYGSSCQPIERSEQSLEKIKEDINRFESSLRDRGFEANQIQFYQLYTLLKTFNWNINRTAEEVCQAMTDISFHFLSTL